MQVTAQVAYPFDHNENTTVHPDRRFASQSKPNLPGHSTAAGYLY
jgi:hypothetical protein